MFKSTIKLSAQDKIAKAMQVFVDAENLTNEAIEELSSQKDDLQNQIDTLNQKMSVVDGDITKASKFMDKIKQILK